MRSRYRIVKDGNGIYRVHERLFFFFWDDLGKMFTTYNAAEEYVGHLRGARRVQKLKKEITVVAEF